MATEASTTRLRGEIPPVSQTPDGLGRYLLLVAVQTAGAAIILWNGLPIYRQIVTDFSKHEPRPEILWWAVAAVVMIQGAYWLRVRIRPPLPKRRLLFVGHLSSFAARLSFIFASSSFTVIFLVRFDDLHLTVARVGMLLALLFSMFCYSLELDRLAKALQETTQKA